MQEPYIRGNEPPSTDREDQFLAPKRGAALRTRRFYTPTKFYSTLSYVLPYPKKFYITLYAEEAALLRYCYADFPTRTPETG